MAREKSKAEWAKIEEELKARGAEYVTKEDFSERMRLYTFSRETRFTADARKEWAETEKKLSTVVQDVTKQIKAHPEFLLPLIQRIVAMYRGIPHLLAEYFGVSEDQLQAILQAYAEDDIEDQKASRRESNLALMPYEQYLQTPEWEMKRDAALQRANKRCELCNSTKFLQVHHKTYENRGQEPLEDLIVLCRDCHSKFHNKLADPEQEQIKTWLFNSAFPKKEN